MSWTTAYWLTIGLMFGATIGIFLWIRWLQRQPVDDENMGQIETHNQPP